MLGVNSYYPYVTRILNFDDVEDFDSNGSPKWDLDQWNKNTGGEPILPLTFKKKVRSG